MLIFKRSLYISDQSGTAFSTWPSFDEMVDGPHELRYTFILRLREVSPGRRSGLLAFDVNHAAWLLMLVTGYVQPSCLSIVLAMSAMRNIFNEFAWSELFCHFFYLST